MTPLIQRLEKLDYLYRTPCPTDHRKMLIWLTESGTALQHQTKGFSKSLSCATGVNKKQAQDLVEQLREIRRQLALAEGSS